MVHVLLTTLLVVAFADEPTPLLPHPPERLHAAPHYTQDQVLRGHPPEGGEEPAEPPQPNFSQDVYRTGSHETEADLDEKSKEELRKTIKRGHELSEVEITKGIVSLNASRYDEAEEHFRAALGKDPRNFVAREYIAELQERKGDVAGAIAELIHAKHLAPEGRWGTLNYHVGRLYLLTRNHERAEIYLRLALAEGGQRTATNYLLGYLLYLEGRYFEAETYLHEAKLRALRWFAPDSEKQILQATNYYLGEIYARLGFTRLAIACFRQTEYGESWEVRNAAWRLHSEINKASFYGTIGLFGQYDSNVILLPTNSSLPSGISNQASAATLFTANAGYQTSPAKRWSLGIDGSAFLSTHLNSTLSAFDVLNPAGDGWVGYWNQRDFSVQARYDASDALTNRKAFSTFQLVQGPMISAAYFPFQRWSWEGGFQYRMNRYTDDPETGPDRRSGYTYSGFFRAAVRSPNPRFRPTLGYAYEDDETKGQDFHSHSHILSASADWRWFTSTHFVAGLTYSVVKFPDNLDGRSDVSYQWRVALNHILNRHWILLADSTLTRNTSTVGIFAYTRGTVTAGVTYTF